MSEKTEKKNNADVVLLDHEYDGIREYDQRLPNWWLLTLYGAIVFSVIYWFFYFQSNVGETDEEQLMKRMAVIEAKNLEESLAMLDNENLWRMSRNPQFVGAGEKVYAAFCQACHGADLRGGIGFDLRDEEWIHGGRPVEIYETVDAGVANTGMTAFGPQLGPKRVAEVVAYILSHHEKGSTAPPEAD